MESKSLGLLIAGVGAVAILIGLVVYHGGLSWFGRLPGDMRIERESFRMFFPLTSMILVSLFLSLVLNLARRFF